jgi:ATP adenylyltransferase
VDRLFSPWRYTYVTRDEKKSTGCVFCSALETDDGRALTLLTGSTCFVILNLYPYNAGHLMVVPKRHVAVLAEVTPDELVELGALTRLSEMALNEVYAPQGINLGMNLGRPAGAGIVDHLHVHLVPRWTGDTNFMSVVGNVRVLPEELPRSAERLRPVFARLAATESAEHDV